ncbi:MAG TPA: hypothetical protein VNK41_07300, partial [Vicinamibacterales bacterium]|nr:hypothetical protein [Vicinamibacterales bacterium]
YRTFDERWPEESGAGERSMRRAVEDVKSKARSAASAATERTRDIAGRARRRLADRGRTAGDRLTEWVNQNPIGAGAMALLAGLVIGLAIPESAQEHRVLGAARDRLIENARRAGREALAVARDTVIEAATGRRTA